jgi:PDZ domain
VAARILDTISKRDSYAFSGDVLPQALGALPVQFTPERARLALGNILDTIRDTATSLFSLEHLARIAQAISLKLSAEQAKSEFDQQLLAAVSKRFLDAMRGTSDPDVLKQVAEQVQRFPLQLTTEQMKAYVLEIIRDNKDPNALYPLLEAVKILRAQLTAHQAQAVLRRFLDVTREADMREDWRLPVTANALTSMLTADQAQAALGPILNAMGRETSLGGLDALIRTIGKIAPRLTTDQAVVALARVLATIPDTTILDTTGPNTMKRYEVLETTALSIEELVSKLATDRQQVQATLGPILTAIQSTRAPNGLWPLLHGLQRLAPHLTNDQAQAALASVLEHWRNTRPMSVHDFVDIAQTVSVLPIRLSDEQMQFALSRTLEELPRWEIGTPMIQTLAGAVDAVAPKLTTAQAESALRAILHAMFSWLSSGWLGIECQDLSIETASRLGLPEPRGVLVTQVASGSPASAKIQEGDVILAFKGKKIDKPISLTRLVGSEQPGKEVVLTLWHGGEKKDLQVTLGEKNIGLSEDIEERVKALIAMANALKALPVPLTAEQAQIVSGGFRKLTRQNTGKTYAPGAMAKVVEALAPKLDYRAKADMLSVIRSILTAGLGDADVRWVRAYEVLLPPSSAEHYDQAKGDMLSVVRSTLSAVGRGDAAVRWAKAYESLLTPSPPEYYIGSIAEALKYPNAAIKRGPSEYELQRDPEEYQTLTASEYFQKKISQRFPDVNEIQSGKLTDLLDWVAKRYPEIDLARPPTRPDLSYVGSSQ